MNKSEPEVEVIDNPDSYCFRQFTNCLGAFMNCIQNCTPTSYHCLTAKEVCEKRIKQILLSTQFADNSDETQESAGSPEKNYSIFGIDMTANNQILILVLIFLIIFFTLCSFYRRNGQQNERDERLAEAERVIRDNHYRQTHGRDIRNHEQQQQRLRLTESVVHNLPTQFNTDAEASMQSPLHIMERYSENGRLAANIGVESGNRTNVTEMTTPPPTYSDLNPPSYEDVIKDKQGGN